jgi:hypothetical protein
MGLTATVIDPLAEPVPAAWDAFVAAERLLPLWRSALVRTADWCARSPSSMVLVQEAGSAATVALFHTRHTAPGRSGRFVRPGRSRTLSMTDCRAVPQVTGPGMAFAAGTTEPDRRAAIRVFERAMRRAGGVAVAYRDLPPAALAVVPTRGRVKLRLSANMVLRNEWADFDGYLATLPRKWRSQLKAIRAALGQEGVRVALAESIDAAEASWLAEVVRARHLPRLLPGPPMPTCYFAHLADLPGSRFLTYRDPDGRLLAFTAVHDSGTDLLLMCWGSRSRTEGGHRNLYFDQYLRMVELMIGTGRRRMVLGKGLPDIKARYGAHPEPLWGVVGLP